MSDRTAQATDERETAGLKLRVNGRERILPEGSDLLALLAELRQDPRLVVVEHNGRILRPKDFAGVDLAEGDRVEIVHLVGGG